MIAVLQWEPLNLKEIRKNICHLLAIRLHPLPTVSPEELRMWKHRILAPGRWDAYQRNDFSEPRLLHLLVHRKALNFLAWDILFSSINSQFFDVLTTCPLLQHFYITWLLLPPPSSSHLLGAVLSGLLEMRPPGLKSLKFPLDKTKLSTFRLWISFKSTGCMRDSRWTWNWWWWGGREGILLNSMCMHTCMG